MSRSRNSETGGTGRELLERVTAELDGEAEGVEIERRSKAGRNQTRAGRGHTDAEKGGGVTPASQRTAGHDSGGTRASTRAPHAPDAPSRHRARRMPVAPAAPARRPESARPDGRRIDGLLPLWVFLIASLAIVGAVALTGAVDSWWILVPAMAVFFTSAFGVLATIMWLLGDDAGAR